MRSAIIFIVIGLSAGCAAGPTLEELEARALVTGDWSLVEKREAQLARRNRPTINCPSGTLGYCESFLGQSRCGCISADLSRLMLGFSR